MSTSEAPVVAVDDDGRLPCLVGTGRRTWHPVEGPAPEPLEMWAEVATAAIDDVGTAADVRRSIDELGVVHCQSWAYDHPADRAVERLGLAAGVRRSTSILAGTSPQRLLDAAALRILRGETRAALVVGGEALATRKVFDRAGEPPPWSHPHPSPPTLPVDLDEWYLPTELAHGVLPAWLTFALLEQARWAARGGRAEDRRRLAALMGRLNAVAQGNPDAWFHAPATGADLLAPTPDNRMVATPFTKRTTAFMEVDMAAANLLVARDVADAWGVPEERRVHLRGWGFARDAIHIAARDDLASSAGMRAATAEAMAVAGTTGEEIDAFDLYSCFGSALQFAGDALGLEPDDPRPISLTGGLPYHGGPSSNYVSHAVSHLVDRLRGHPDETALTTGIGMHMTKHVAAVWSVQPGAIGAPADHGGQRWGDEGHVGDRPVRDHHRGRARLVSATVVHDREGDPDHVIGICELDDGSRCYARTRDEEALAAVGGDAWVRAAVEVRPAEHGTNELRLIG